MPKSKLKCKFPPCPCQKCVELRDGRLAGGCSHTDTPPERPIVVEENRKEYQCTCKPHAIGPSYTIKNQLMRLSRTRATEHKVKRREADLRNPDHNFLNFIINVVSFIAFAIVGILIFWLKMLHWTYILCLKVYNGSRTTQVAVASVIGCLLLAMLCTYAMKGNANLSQSKNHTPCKGPNCGPEPKEFTITITDDKARELYKQSKLYAVPMDMKQPPALLVYLRSIMLKDA